MFPIVRVCVLLKSFFLHGGSLYQTHAGQNNYLVSNIISNTAANFKTAIYYRGMEWKFIIADKLKLMQDEIFYHHIYSYNWKIKFLIIVLDLKNLSEPQQI